MKNFSEEEKKNLRSINKKLWSIFEALRNAHISTEDYHILLFLLSLYNDGLLNNIILDKSKDSIYEISNRFKPKYGNQIIKYESILPIFLPVIEFLSSETLNKIIHEIHGIDRQFLSNNFETIFNQVLHHITNSKILQVDNFIQTAEITDLMLAVCNIKKGGSIFNPFADAASSGSISNSENLYLLW